MCEGDPEQAERQAERIGLRRPRREERAGTVHHETLDQGAAIEEVSRQIDLAPQAVFSCKLRQAGIAATQVEAGPSGKRQEMPSAWI